MAPGDAWKRDYRLFAFDLDGTLLFAGELPEEVAAFVRGLARWARVTLATGRSLASVRPYVEPLGVNAPAILYHGAVVWDFAAERAVLEKRLPPAATLRALAALEKFPVEVQLYRAASDPTIYVREETEEVREFARVESLPLSVANLEELARERPLKLLVIGDPDSFPLISAAIRSVAPELTVVRAARRYLEILPPGVNKGQTLVWLARSLGIPLDKVAAAGDQESDLEMILRAGLGVAMASAPEAVKQQADLVVSSVEELADYMGLGQAAEKGGKIRPKGA